MKPIKVLPRIKVSKISVDFEFEYEKFNLKKL